MKLKPKFDDQKQTFYPWELTEGTVTQSPGDEMHLGSRTLRTPRRFDCTCTLIRHSKAADGMCSFGTNHLTIHHDEKTTRIDRSSIVSIFPRICDDSPTAIEVFARDGRSYFLNFAPTSSNEILAAIDWDAKDSLKEITTNWVNRKISNFSYLMYLNVLSGRSFDSENRYPILPNLSNRTVPFPVTFPMIAKVPKYEKPDLPSDFFFMPDIFSDLDARFDYIYENRKILESDEISKTLHNWIDGFFTKENTIQLFEMSHPARCHIKIELLQASTPSF
jgi:hypothetical protein